MCNLYRVRKSVAEIAAHFGVQAPRDIIVPADSRPGEPGIIIRRGGDSTIMQKIGWGFPRYDPRDPAAPLKPVNLVADLTNPMWSAIAQDARYRCLIPLTDFAEPYGPRGHMTRAWYSVTGWPLLAWAGFCRTSKEWGPVYAGMTTDSNEAVKELNPRMPVLLAPSEYERWLAGPIKDVIGFQFRQFPVDRLTVDWTDQLWVPRVPKEPKQPKQASLF